MEILWIGTVSVEFRVIRQNSTETVPFHKVSAPENFGILRSHQKFLYGFHESLLSISQIGFMRIIFFMKQKKNLKKYLSSTYDPAKHYFY